MYEYVSQSAVGPTAETTVSADHIRYLKKLKQRKTLDLSAFLYKIYVDAGNSLSYLLDCLIINRTRDKCYYNFSFADFTHIMFFEPQVWVLDPAAQQTRIQME